MSEKAPPFQKGADHWRAVLTEEQVYEIRSSREPGTVLAERYHVTPATISRIRLRRIWKHL